MAAQGCREIGLFGLRLGGTLARVYAEANTGVSFLILWEPIIKVREYLYECLRANLTTQMMQRGKILKNRQVLLADLAEGTPVNVSGYLITKMYYEGCKDIDLENLDQYPAPSYVVHIRAGYRHPDTIDYMQEDEDGETSALSRFKKKYTHPKSREEVTSASYAFWNEPLKYYYTHYEELFNRSLAWLDGIRGKA